MIGYLDTETDGLLEGATTIHCIAVSFDGQEPGLYVGEADIRYALDQLSQCDVLVGHNLIGFDLPLLFKLLGWKSWPGCILEDTLVQSALLCPDIQGGHSLGAWGARLGIPKGTHTDFAQYSPEMGSYCQQDVRLLVALHRHLSDERFNKGWDWSRSLKLETQFAKGFANQAYRGVMIDLPYAEKLLQQIAEEMRWLEAKVAPLLPQRPMKLGEERASTPPKLQFKKDGTPSAVLMKWFDAVEHSDNLPEYGGDEIGWFGLKYGRWVKLPHHEPIGDSVPMKLGDQPELKAWLQECGWQPTMWTYCKEKDKLGKMRHIRDKDGQLIQNHPKIHDKGVMCPGLEQISDSFPVAKDVVRWMIIRHRQGLITSVVKARRPNGRVPATGMSLGTPTARVTHAVVANIPKGDPEIVLGKECRSIFIAPPGRVLVGVDASGLEMRMLAHYVGSQELNRIVIHGTKENGDDIHSVLHKACAEWVSNRSVQKNVNYGWLYGASDKKLALTANHPDDKAKEVGALIRAALVKGVPGLEELMQKVERAAKRGFVRGLDGRKIPVRSKHSTLNTLLQSAGSIVVKHATNYMNCQLRKLGLQARQVIHYHDECQLEAVLDVAQQAGLLFIAGLKDAEQVFNLTCPLDGEVKVGRSWADTH